MQRGKSTNNLRRSSKNQESRSYFLIVVEGQETEYNYFKSLKEELKLPPTTTIKIAPASGGDPLVIVTEAYKLYQENQEKSKTGNTIKFDQVFCVFDDDNKPEKYKKALKAAKEYNFTSITSIPCFEFWFLLHYCYTTSPFSSYKELSPKLETEMRKAAILKKGETYNKSDKFLYQKLKLNQEKAIDHAIQLEQKHPNEDGCTNPSTKVHILVDKLQKQKNFE
ncbi:RloB domain-containing protein [Anabaena cylindrica FACHB-243]|uniref:CRISPR-associated protein, Csm2 family n=1 Tax=Anabaena cylindrica (strain ATCC 27899 / PCC 7122) TaxID=272123 RepID=K9ZHR7_ANACC|nr:MULTISPECIES: RloB family protein [Anabaena]AFZ58117.1 CRISPR-associated protein, Csm2 family [Anabaena cylindrica PCC 7122]MBD2419108.1 RloB domain-containing protein [Anabaena cylindrica FACHB-243]MBY5280683.1 RloB domain-containing protein [Anabaena sp. CCAP 1446/1C]MBY5310593.1 RloB domain-containing protein [Anabaena sp. CCAP 1446/1C]MCM2409578.1 RloB family protein [Anabaena sp. CCAP 1446/1C]